MYSRNSRSRIRRSAFLACVTLFLSEACSDQNPFPRGGRGCRSASIPRFLAGPKSTRRRVHLASSLCSDQLRSANVPAILETPAEGSGLGCAALRDLRQTLPSGLACPPPAEVLQPSLLQKVEAATRPVSQAALPRDRHTIYHLSNWSEKWGPLHLRRRPSTGLSRR